MNPAIFEHPPFAGHALLDSGAGEKLERFGEVILRRPDPQALWSRSSKPEHWDRAHLRFVRESDRGGRWEVGPDAPAVASQSAPEWPCHFGEACFLVRPTAFKHLGVFPEQAANWRWVARARASFEGQAPRLLNLFGYTGSASVLALQAGYEVTHVDASRTAIAWALDNLEASGLDRKAMRVICDDALAFARREVRRGARYDAVLLDPPHYGRGPAGEIWRFEESIAALLQAVARLLAPRSFVVLSTYAMGTSPLALANLMTELEGGEVQAQAGDVQASEVQASEVQAQASEVQASEAQAGEMQASEAQAGEMQASEAQAGEMQASEMQASEAQAGEMQACEVQAGEAQAGEMQACEVQAGELALPREAGGRALPAGFCARWSRGLAAAR